MDSKKKFSLLTFFYSIILLICLPVLPLFSQTKIIKEGDVWKYYHDKEAPPEDWIDSSHITSDWKTGITELGYGDNIVTTDINDHEKIEDVHHVAYFTKSFEIEDPFKFLLYQINIEKDDGVVLYLNGREIFRRDMPFGDVDHYTLASSLIVSSKMEAYFHPVILSPEDFDHGENILSASVHQGTSDSEDLIFNLELVGHNDLEMVPLLMKERTIKNLTLDLRLKELSHKQEVEKRELEHQMLEQVNADSKNNLFVLLILYFLSFIMVLFLWNYFRKKIKGLEGEVISLKEVNRDKDLEMMSVTLNSLNNRQFLKGIKKELDKSIKNGGADTIKKEIKKVINNIDYAVDSSEDWENLKKQFNIIHSGYVDKLSELHPSLTDIELRHCIFIKLHMQTKEIAGILNIDPKSVQSSRYRIKKKMGLSESTALKEYLMSI